MAKRFLVFLMAVVCFGCQSKQTGETWGYFEPDEVKVTLLKDGRELRLEEDFAFVDKRNKRWVAPSGSVVNGASIPGSLWSIVGSPLVGKYRNASIIHDVGCEEKTSPSDEVHQVFYEACRAGGVDESNAQLMYWAVYHFGPTWEVLDAPTSEEQQQLNEQLKQVEQLADRAVLAIPPRLQVKASPLQNQIKSRIAELKQRNQRNQLYAKPQELRAILQRKDGTPEEKIKRLKTLLPKLKELRDRKPGDTILLPSREAPPEEEVERMLRYIREHKLQLEELKNLQPKETPK